MNWEAILRDSTCSRDVLGGEKDPLPPPVAGRLNPPRISHPLDLGPRTKQCSNSLPPGGYALDKGLDRGNRGFRLLGWKERWLVNHTTLERGQTGDRYG